MTPRAPRLLDANFHELARLSVVKLALHQTLSPLSTAELVTTCDPPEIGVRDMLELFDENGSAGVYRVAAVSEDLGRTRTLTLEHGLCTLRDSVIPAQGFTAGVRETLERLLDCQSTALWALGDVEAPTDMTVIFATGYANLLDAVETLLSMLPEGYALDFDQSVTPWLLHLRKLSDGDACEGRLTRNLQSIRETVDGSRLCTRVYPFGAEIEDSRVNLVPLSGSDHAESEAAATLGVISRTFENDLIFDVLTLNEVAQKYLERHALPEVTLTVHAMDLSAATGETIDAFRLGRMCRLCLPDQDLVLRQRIIAIDKPDVHGTPGLVTLTLSNRLKIQSEAEELDEMVRQVTAGKLIGGEVTEVVDTNRAYGSYPSPIVHYFEIEDWAAVLDVRVNFKPDIGVTMRDIRVDSVYPDDSLWAGYSFSALPFLDRDDLGQIARGEHKLIMYPSNGNYGENCGVSSTVTMTVIPKSVT